MRDVMMKAQELAETILNSTVFQAMKDAEAAVDQDVEASGLLRNMAEKRQTVENILSSASMTPDALAAASMEMEKAENDMNSHPKIQKLKAARKDFQTMMDNVNRILRLVITGKAEDETSATARCSGSCDGCNGCG